MRTRIIVLLLVGVTLAVPAGASAHARSATVALDYRLQLDRSTRSIHSVSVAILDGDRSLRVGAKGVTVVVRGNLGEPMLCIALVRAREPRRSQLAGLLGAVAAALSLGSLGAFRHGVVVSLLSATGSRSLLAIALVGGTGAAVTSFVGGENT